MLGGVQAVTWTDVKQMVVIVAAVCAAVATLVIGLPSNVSLGEALHVAGATGRLTAIDFSFDPNNTYTFWSGLIGGLFLMLSYFGCDQSQVQRYLTAKSVEEGRQSLFVSAYVKIPLQALILLTGVLVFTHYLFVRPPMLFNPMHDRTVQGTTEAGHLASLDTEFGQAFQQRRDAATALASAHGAGDASAIQAARAQFLAADGRMLSLRKDAVDLVKRASGDASYTDVNYVFPTFITTTMPMGLVGLMIAAIFAAAMSAIGAELNALATASLIDVYKRWLKPDATDRHYLLVSRTATGCWALVACTVALYAARLGSLIEVVNRFGSFFYGSLLGVFMLAIGTKRATGTGAFIGLIAGMSTVAWVAVRMPSISFLWYNVIGATAVVLVGMAVSAVDGPARKLEPHA
jgi:Na+/proline symporter